MRYRPLGKSAMSVSAVSLSLVDNPARPRPSDWEAIVYSALENGVNAFEVVGRHPSIGEGLAKALQAVERRLVCVAWRLGWALGPAGAPVRDFSAEALTRTIQGVLTRTGLGYLDVALLDDPQADELNPPALAAMKALREAGRLRWLGVTGQDDAMDAYISSGAFDVVCLPYNLISGWKDRLRLKAAVERDMAVFGFNYYPDVFRGPSGPAPKTSTWGGANSDNPLAGAGTYAFLDRTQGWLGEEICLAYALTEPSLATIQIAADRPQRIEALAAVTERDLPPGVAAQIEMARFSPTGPGQRMRRA